MAFLRSSAHIYWRRESLVQFLAHDALASLAPAPNGIILRLYRLGSARRPFTSSLVASRAVLPADRFSPSSRKFFDRR